MNCAEVKYYLNDYSKGILLDEVRAEIHEHLNCCKSCTKVLDNMISISDAASAKKKIVRQNKRIWERVHKEREKNNRAQKSVPRIFPASSRISSEAHHLKSSLMLKANEIENNKLLVIAGIISVIALGVILAFMIFDHPPASFWYVEKVSGYPVIESKVLTDQGIKIIRIQTCSFKGKNQCKNMDCPKIIFNQYSLSRVNRSWLYVLFICE